MNKALDELVSDYVYYVLATKPPARGFTEWCNDPVLCDQELLAQTTISRAHGEGWSRPSGGSIRPGPSHV